MRKRLTRCSSFMAQNLAHGKALRQKSRHKARHRGSEIVRPAHDADVGEFRLLLVCQMGEHPRAQSFSALAAVQYLDVRDLRQIEHGGPSRLGCEFSYVEPGFLLEFAPLAGIEIDAAARDVGGSGRSAGAIKMP